jgi:hypothetical protein
VTAFDEPSPYLDRFGDLMPAAALRPRIRRTRPNMRPCTHPQRATGKRGGVSTLVGWPKIMPRLRAASWWKLASTTPNQGLDSPA